MKPVDQRSPPRQSAPATAKPNFPPSVAQRTHLSPAAPTQNPSRPALHPAKTQNENCCYEFICKRWTLEPERFRLDPLHQMPGLNIIERQHRVTARLAYIDAL